MTRKNLSDLVRKEAQKPNDDMESKDGSAQVDDVHQSEEIHNIELDAIAAKLKDVLAEAKRKEDILQAEIEQLKSELQDQKKLVTTLKTELTQTDKLKAEFVEAKAVILQLTEANQFASERTVMPTRQIIETFNTDTDIGSWLG